MDSLVYLLKKLSGGLFYPYTACTLCHCQMVESYKMCSKGISLF